MHAHACVCMCVHLQPEHQARLHGAVTRGPGLGRWACQPLWGGCLGILWGCGWEGRPAPPTPPVQVLLMLSSRFWASVVSSQEGLGACSCICFPVSAHSSPIVSPRGPWAPVTMFSWRTWGQLRSHPDLVSGLSCLSPKTLQCASRVGVKPSVSQE